MDMKENDRPSKIRELENSYDDVIEAIKNGTLGKKDQEEDVSPDEMAFMSAARRGQSMILPPVMPGEDTIGSLPE